jgi:serine phosphatase RsbU (regulator of sigma subunit)/tetratricopeptide (TPR) repeat protein
MKRLLYILLLIFIASLSVKSNVADSLKMALKKKGISDEMRVELLGDLSYEYCFIDPDSGLLLARSILPIAASNRSDKMKTQAYMVIAVNYFILQKFDSAEFYYKKSILYGEKKNDLKILSNAYNNLALVYMDKSEFKPALEFLNKALEVRIKLKNKKTIAETYDNIGLVYQAVADYPKALEFQFKSLAIAEKINNEKLMSTCYHNLAITFDKHGEHSKSLQYSFKALNLLKDTTNHYETGLTLSNISLAYNLVGLPFSSYLYLQKSLKHTYALGDFRASLTSYNNLGMLFLHADDSLKNYLKLSPEQCRDSALYYFDKVIYLNKSEYNYRSICNAYLNKSELFKIENNFKEAKRSALMALENAEKTEAYELIQKIYKELSDLSALLNQMGDAYQYLTKYYKVREKVYSIQNSNELTKQELNHEYNKKHLADSLIRVKEKQLDQERIHQQQSIIEEKEFRMYLLYGGIALVLLFSYFLYNRIKLINLQKETIEHQKTIVEEKQKEITDSINYAKRIQYSLLAHEDVLKQNLNDYFVLFKPKDIVSGDFYWCTKKDNYFYLAVCDCTGHGVPGAFMSLLNISFLNEAITEKNIVEPQLILNHVRTRLIENMEGKQDGMDAILVKFEINPDKKPYTNLKIEYAAANNHPVLISNGLLNELKADKMPVGKGEKMDSFSSYVINAQKGDMIYLYTDGYADQFGGPKGKKFKYANLQKLLQEIQGKDSIYQTEILNHNFNDWKGDLEQVDDVCILGFKI